MRLDINVKKTECVAITEDDIKNLEIEKGLHNIEEYNKYKKK